MTRSVLLVDEPMRGGLVVMDSMVIHAALEPGCSSLEATGDEVPADRVLMTVRQLAVGDRRFLIASVRRDDAALTTDVLLTLIDLDPESVRAVEVLKPLTEET